ncbi:MAG: patatin-like phospholipase family protein [Pseudomonadota bacterium]
MKIIKTLTHQKLAKVLTFILPVIGLIGCGPSVLRAPLTTASFNNAEVVGVGPVRKWGDEPLKNIAQMQKVRIAQIRKTQPKIFRKKNHTVRLLALSGGGGDGAFGAGMLNGWTARGTRPKFDVVAGVSAGGLLAPFAFLGSDYDDEAKEVFTQYSTDDLLRTRILAGLLGGDAVTSAEPLAKIIASYVTKGFLAKIAREYRKGRRLLIGTTNLDAQRPVVWDMGRIAAQNTKQSLQLFRKILLASASIPGVFPPIFLDVKSDGKEYKEMHVDGGVTDNAFLLPAEFNIKKFQIRPGVRWKAELYIIVNSKTGPEPEIVKDTTFSIAGRSVSTLIKQQTQGDILKMYIRAKKNGIGFNLASVPQSFSEKSKEAFDKEYMRALFKVGYDAAKKGYSWRKRPREL